MAELITEQELNAMRNRGATIKREPREVVSEELNAALKDVSNAITEKRSVEVVAAIGELTKAVHSSKTSPTDLSPILSTLTRLVDAMSNKPTYRFNISRNSKGQMTMVTAIPDTGADT